MWICHKTERQDANIPNNQTPQRFTLTGELADWLEDQADRNTRTPSQQATYFLQGIKHRKEEGKRANEERKAKREALGFPTRNLKAA
ncbi:hypothetical protein [Thiothrix winogradskyi]|uniref:Uncharacterized protein n=1 Tax=Thiothrix winogradskyi TaxID=96472 RepID=A0ABY3T5V3_9GAMM|nr:hypothetical protein [Thiothrix winogradskyi]UJS26051.1 hypothetical protein L2Y54_08430 [Thiothrix winogradskyi]